MKKSFGRDALHLLICAALTGCVTPQKVDPVADYCATLATVLRNCESILEGNSAGAECFEAPDTLTEKFEAAMNSLPDKTQPRLKFTMLNLDVAIFFLDYALKSVTKGQSKKTVDAEDIV